MAVFPLTGAELCAVPVTKGRKYIFEESADIKNSLAVRDCDVFYGEEIVGYITGSPAALLKTFITRGFDIYCVYCGEEERGEGVKRVVKVYYIPKKI